MKKFIILLLSVIIGLGGVITVSATETLNSTTYYISNAGDDNNNGTSEKTPFKTFAKVNNILLKAGDKVLLRRGDEWNERLEILAQGTKENFVEVSCYGDENLNKPMIRLTNSNDDICILVKDFYNKNGKAVAYPFRFLKINNLDLRDSRLGIFLRCIASVNEKDESKRNRDVIIQNVDINNMWCQDMSDMIDKEREIEAEYPVMKPGQEGDRDWSSIINECGKRTGKLITDALEKSKCNLPIIKDGNYEAVGGGGLETIFPAGIFVGGKRPAVYSVTEGANISNIDKSYPTFTNLRVEDTNIIETCTGIMTWFYNYNATKNGNIWKGTTENIAIKNVIVTGSINGGIAIDASNGGGILNGETVKASDEGWGKIENLRVIAGSSKKNGTFINGSCGAILNVSKNLLFENCEFAGINNQNNPDGCGFDMESSCENFEVKDSFFHNNAGGAILMMDSANGPHSNLFIHNNLFYNNLVDGYKGGPRAPGYEDKRYIQLYNGRKGQYLGSGIGNKNIILKDNHFYYQRQNNVGTNLLLDPLIGPVVEEEDGGYRLINNTLGYFENSMAEKYLDLKTNFKTALVGKKLTLDNIAINTKIYKNLLVQIGDKTELKGKVSITDSYNKKSNEESFTTKDGIIRLGAIFGNAYNTMINKVEITFEGISDNSKVNAEFILDEAQKVSITGKNEISLKVLGDSQTTFSGRLTKDDFSVSINDFGNEIISAKLDKYNEVYLTFKNDLSERQKSILLTNASISIAPNAYIRIFKEIHQAKEPNREMNKKSYYYNSNIKIDVKPTKLIYKKGEDIDLSGLKMSAINADGTTSQISYTKVTVENYDNKLIGKQSIILRYLDKTAILEIEVQDERRGCACGTVSVNATGTGIGLMSLSLIGLALFMQKKKNKEV